MKEVVKPKTPKEEYELDDADYLLIVALKDLTEAINKLYRALDK